MARFYSTTYYAVKRGHKPGIYTNYGEVLDQIDDFDKAVWRKFTNRADAEAFLRGPDVAAESIEKLTERYANGERHLEKTIIAMLGGKTNGNHKSNTGSVKIAGNRASTRTRNAGYARRGTGRVR